VKNLRRINYNGSIAEKALRRITFMINSYLYRRLDLDILNLQRQKPEVKWFLMEQEKKFMSDFC
jgi:hypothetical protein